MKRLDRYEREILAAYRKGAVISAHPTRAQRAAFVGVPYQTLIASVIHKYVSGRLLEKKSRLARASKAARKRGRSRSLGA